MEPLHPKLQPAAAQVVCHESLNCQGVDDDALRSLIGRRALKALDDTPSNADRQPKPQPA